MRKRIVITGSGGRLGAALVRAYSDRHEVTAFPRAALDLAQPGAATAALDPLEFDLLVNCAALTNVDYCETNEAEAMQINAHAVGEIAQSCSSKGARLIHISTDYVFDGEAPGALSEDAPANPVSLYGLSKHRGEEELLAAGDQHLAVRVSWVFGPDRPSFVDAILQRALKEESLAAVGDKYSSPTYTLDAVQYLEELFELPEARGILHLCNSGGCSWQEYGQYAIDCAVGAGIPMRGRKVEGLKLTDMANFVAVRPRNTVLDTSKLGALLGHPPRSWKEAVSEYVTRYFARQD